MIFTVDEQTKSVKMKLEPEELELAKSSPESFQALLDMKDKITYEEIMKNFNLFDQLKTHNG